MADSVDNTFMTKLLREIQAAQTARFDEVQKTLSIIQMAQVTDRMRSMRRFDVVGSQFDALRDDFNALRADFNAQRADIVELREDLTAMIDSAVGGIQTNLNRRVLALETAGKPDEGKQ